MQKYTAQEYISELVSANLEYKKPTPTSGNIHSYVYYAKAYIGEGLGYDSEKSQSKISLKDMKEWYFKGDEKHVRKLLVSTAMQYLTRAAVDDLVLYSKEAGFKCIQYRQFDREDFVKWGYKTEEENTYLHVLKEEELELDLILSSDEEKSQPSKYALTEDDYNDPLWGVRFSDINSAACVVSSGVVRPSESDEDNGVEYKVTE